MELGARTKLYLINLVLILISFNVHSECKWRDNPNNLFELTESCQHLGVYVDKKNQVGIRECLNAFDKIKDTNKPTIDHKIAEGFLQIDIMELLDKVKDKDLIEYKRNYYYFLKNILKDDPNNLSALRTLSLVEHFPRSIVEEAYILSRLIEVDEECSIFYYEYMENLYTIYNRTRSGSLGASPYYNLEESHYKEIDFVKAELYRITSKGYNISRGNRQLSFAYRKLILLLGDNKYSEAKSYRNMVREDRLKKLETEVPGSFTLDEDSSLQAVCNMYIFEFEFVFSCLDQIDRLINDLRTGNEKIDKYKVWAIFYFTDSLESPCPTEKQFLDQTYKLGGCSHLKDIDVLKARFAELILSSPSVIFGDYKNDLEKVANRFLVN